MPGICDHDLHPFWDEILVTTNLFWDSLQSGVSFESYDSGLFSSDVVGRGKPLEPKLFQTGVHGVLIGTSLPSRYHVRILTKGGRNIPGTSRSTLPTTRTTRYIEFQDGYTDFRVDKRTFYSFSILSQSGFIYRTFV